MTKQWKAIWPYIANAVFRFVQNHAQKSYFCSFFVGRSPQSPPSGFALLVVVYFNVQRAMPVLKARGIVKPRTAERHVHSWYSLRNPGFLVQLCFHVPY